jgi:hypothetical protein
MIVLRSAAPFHDAFQHKNQSDQSCDTKQRQGISGDR